MPKPPKQYTGHTKVHLRHVIKGEFFTLREITDPLEDQVWVKDGYDASTKKHLCHNFDDISRARAFNGSKEVWIGFTF